MSEHSIHVAALACQILTLIGLAVYCVETYRIRLASQRQIEVSQGLLQSSLDQIEGASKPCVTFASELRDGVDVILEMNGAAGNLVARPDHGHYVIKNIGSGAGLNLRYYMTKGNPEFDAPAQRTYRYIPTIQASAQVTLVETIGNYNAAHEATFEYESLGGRKYRSTIALNNRVITSFRFQEIEKK